MRTNKGKIRLAPNKVDHVFGIPLIIFIFFTLLTVSGQKCFGQSMTINYSTPQSYPVGAAITPLTPTVTGGPPSSAGQTTSTFAGNNGSAGYMDGTGTNSLFNLPLATAVDAAGNIYVADANNHRIRKISTAGVVTTLAGSGSASFADGNGTAASFNHPAGVAVDIAGNVYVADQINNRIRKISPAGSVITLAGSGSAGSTDNTGTLASFNNPTGVCVDGSGNVFVSDYSNNKIRKITPAGTVSTFAGTGVAGLLDGTTSNARFKNPMTVALDAAGNMFVADRLNHAIRKITPSLVVSTLAGNGTAGSAGGTGSSATFYQPTSIAVEPSGNVVVNDQGNNLIRRITPSGAVTTLAGALTSGTLDGTGTVVRFNNPYGLCVNAKGEIYVAEANSHLIRKMITSAFTISPELPAGLSFSNTTGIINGTPNAVSPATNYAVTAYNTTNTASTTLSIEAKVASFNVSLDQNYVITHSPSVAGIKNNSDLVAAIAANKAQTTVEYADGLGRIMQSINVKASPQGNDVVSYAVYDSYGREYRKYLPFVPSTGANGSYRAGPGSDLTSFYANPPNGVVQIPSGQVTYGETKLETSPLSRPTEEGFPGLSWQLDGGHTIKTTYGLNTSIDAIKQWELNLLGGASYSKNYDLNVLSKKTVTDENGNQIIEFKDKNDRIICRKIQSGASTFLTTDYIYDDLGQLSYVIPPLPGANGANPSVTMPTSFSETDNVFLNFFYSYHYDGLGRQVEKKIPGQGWRYMVYNNRDQLIMSQDANQKISNIWVVTKYDGLGRVIINGKYYNTTATRATLQATADTYASNLFEDFSNSTTFYGYTSVSWPNISTGTNNKVLSVNYYDTYDIINNPSVNPGSIVFTAPDPLVDSLDRAPAGLPVATLTNVLGTTNYLFTVTHYDIEGKPSKIINQHYQGGVIAYNKYDTEESNFRFQGLPLQTIRKHYLPNSTSPQLIINSWSTYDPENRPLLNKQQFIIPTSTGAIITVSKFDYNEIGQLRTKHLHSTDAAVVPLDGTFLQHIDFRYNSRGWVNKINDPTQTTDQTFITNIDVFSEQLDYDQSSTGYAIIPQYNGNISAVKWQTKNPLSITLPQEQKGYVFSYDPLNRLTNAASKATASGNGMYDEALAYDDLGNIVNLTRKKTGTVLHNILYNYTVGGVRSNKLNTTADNGTVSESQATTYTYNTNGNLTGDSKKAVTQILYNELNLPATVIITAGNKSINYTYDAAGTKLERIIKTGSTVNEDRIYDNGVEYTNNGIELIHTSEGRVIPSTGPYIYEYYATDHLGNVRAVFGDKNNDGVLTTDEIVQTTDNYAFGREINYSQNSIPGPDNKYKYNGKEYQFDLSEYDYGARFYDPVIGRWTSVDPMAENSIAWSPYNYVVNNPISNTDPDGMDYQNGIYENGLYGNTVVYSASNTSTTFFGHNYSVDENKNKIKGSDTYYTETNDDPKKSKKQTYPWYTYFNDHRPGGDFLYEFNKLFNPIAIVLNSVSTYTTGYDTYGVKQSNGEATANLVMLIPIMKGGRVINFLGSTGRVLAASLAEELAMKEVLQNPSLGRRIMVGQVMKDARWAGWVKMEYKTASGITIHYVAEVKSGIITAVDDFKFK